jgi:mannose-6-phosphate isomerase
MAVSAKQKLWYILQSDPDAKLVLGFNKDVNKKEYLRKTNNGTIEDVFNYQASGYAK